MTPRTRTTLLAAVVALALALMTGCSDQEQELSDSDHNAEDVAFAHHMIPHHAQALSLVDLLRDRDVDAELVTLAEGMRETQTEEIEQFADWLDEWDEPVPPTMRDHVHAGHGPGRPSDGLRELERRGPGPDGMGGMAGMLTYEDFRELEDAEDDATFTRLWLEAMIEHHEGAVEMAEEEVAEGRHRPTVELAESIASSQRDEIETMQEMLDAL